MIDTLRDHNSLMYGKQFCTPKHNIKTSKTLLACCINIDLHIFDKVLGDNFSLLQEKKHQNPQLLSTALVDM